jgi:hypothetical protein|tara:strand:+ start:297 stop:449 length:153 start_codon:yes stop_codon:yes gene_type:complete
MLTKKQQSLLSKHSDHHSKKHMDEMKKAMTKKNPLTFSQAHKIAMKKVGK